MILQTANIVSGFVLSSSKIKEHEQVRPLALRAEGFLLPIQEKLGFAVLALGVIGLLVRMGFVFLWIPMLGASFPQAIPAILIGLILTEAYWKKYPRVHEKVLLLVPHRVVIGFVGMASGAGSLLFGCVLPIVCGVY